MSAIKPDVKDDPAVRLAIRIALLGRGKSHAQIEKHRADRVKEREALLSSIQRKFGLVGLEVANAVVSFSFDLVGVVCEYAMPHGFARLDTQASRLFTFGWASGDGEGKLNGPCDSIACSPVDGRYWVASKGQVYIYSKDGEFLRTPADLKPQKKARVLVSGIALDSGSSEAFLCCASSNRVLVCSLAGDLLRAFGSVGVKPAQFSHASAIATDNNGLLCVSDQNNNRVQVFQRDGSFVRAFGQLGSKIGQLESPKGLAILNNCVYVADSRNNRVQEFNLSTGAARIVCTVGQPNSIAFDLGGNLLISAQIGDKYGYDKKSRVLAFTRAGNLLVRDVLSSAGMHTTACCVAVDREGRVVVGSDARPHSVIVFAFPKFGEPANAADEIEIGYQ